MKIVKFLKNIFSHPSVCVYIFKGLVVAEASLKSAVEALKTQSVEFKYMSALESVLKYMTIVREYMANFIMIFGANADKISAQALQHEQTVRGLSTDNEYTSSLEEIGSKIKGSVL